MQMIKKGFQRGTVIGCHLCNESSREISSILNIPKSTVGFIIRKWTSLGTTATQPGRGRPGKLTEGSADAEAQSGATELQTSCDLQMSPRTVRRELHGMSVHGRAAASQPYITKANAERRVQWCKARRHWTLEQARPSPPTSV
uniref:Transposase Tc1-like domain-containing protein n=1 Tax=Takifugu rubripes TaxID=31033 RepID=A0A674MYP6_TAKRU